VLNVLINQKKAGHHRGRLPTFVEDCIALVETDSEYASADGDSGSVVEDPIIQDNKSMVTVSHKTNRASALVFSDLYELSRHELEERAKK